MPRQSSDLAVRNAKARKRAILAEIAEINEFVRMHREMAKAGPYRANEYYVEIHKE